MEETVFVTLFDSHYMSRGLVMYESLKNVMNKFLLYIIAFDDKAYKKLISLGLENVVVISLQEFEDEDLLTAKKNRNNTEYCWTCSSKSILYVMEKYGVSECTYIDADICFFSNPKQLIAEMNINESVLITEHRYSAYCDQTETSGKYCVQFVTFKNDLNGRKALKWWVNRCLEWCYNRMEEGKFGDQMYLNYFTELFNGVHELKHLGGGVAPWNVNQYTFYKKNEKIFLRTKDDKQEFPVVFYHFHALSFFDKDVVQLSNGTYDIPDTAISHLYKYYLRMTEMVCIKYGLSEDKSYWLCEKNFRDDDMDNLQHNRLYYNYSLFV